MMQREGRGHARAGLAIALAVLIVSACTAPAPPSAPAPAVPLPVPSAAVAAVVSMPPPPVPSDPPAPAPSAPLAAPPVVIEGRNSPTPATPGPGEASLDAATTEIPDIDAWLATRHLTHAALPRVVRAEPGCRSLTLAGVKPELLVCDQGGMDQTSGYQDVYVVAVDGGAARLLLDLPRFLTDDPDFMGPRSAHNVSASVFVRDGRDLVVREDGGSCSASKTTLSPGYRARVAAMCAGIGRYVWSAGRFARVGPP